MLFRSNAPFPGVHPKCSGRSKRKTSSLRARILCFCFKKNSGRVLESQNGACKICGKVDPGRISSKRLAVDHDHTTGKVRGILCFRCNMGLGCFNDNIEIIKKVINYLTNPEVNDKLEISL